MSDPSPSGSAPDEGEVLVAAATASIRPILRELIARGVPFGRLDESLREAFVAIAESEFAAPGRRVTDSRVSLLTGLNRKEVKRLRGRSGEGEGSSAFSRNRAASLVSRWLNDDAANDDDGRPRPLPYQAAKGPNFVAIARDTTVDVSPRALLDELVRSGAATWDESSQQVALTEDAYVPRLDRTELLSMLTTDPAELVDTMCHNILHADGDTRRLQRKVSYDNLGEEGLAELRRELREEGERFVRRSDRVLAKRDRDRHPRAPGGARRYAGIGVYYFEADEPPATRLRGTDRQQGEDDASQE